MKHRWLRLLWRAQRGAAMVETALAFPLLALAGLALLQFGIFYHSQTVVTSAVQEGARVAAEEDRGLQDGVDYANQLLRAGLGRSAGDVQLQATDAGYAVAFEARGQMHLILPWAVDAHLPLWARSVVSKEQFRVGPGSGL
jgi:Flp pilus assembly protein TadG